MNLAIYKKATRNANNQVVCEVCLKPFLYQRPYLTTRMNVETNGRELSAGDTLGHYFHDYCIQPATVPAMLSEMDKLKAWIIALHDADPKTCHALYVFMHDALNERI